MTFSRFHEWNLKINIRQLLNRIYIKWTCTWLNLRWKKSEKCGIALHEVVHFFLAMMEPVDLFLVFFIGVCVFSLYSVSHSLYWTKTQQNIITHMSGTSVYLFCFYFSFRHKNLFSVTHSQLARLWRHFHV